MTDEEFGELLERIGSLEYEAGSCNDVDKKSELLREATKAEQAILTAWRERGEK